MQGATFTRTKVVFARVALGVLGFTGRIAAHPLGRVQGCGVSGCGVGKRMFETPHTYQLEM